jgi:hypothetical protein
MLVLPPGGPPPEPVSAEFAEGYRAGELAIAADPGAAGWANPFAAGGDRRAGFAEAVADYREEEDG